MKVLVLVIAALCASAVRSAGFVGLGHLPGIADSLARAVSDDSTVVVGSVFDCGPRGCSIGVGKAFRWTEADGMVDLGYLPGGTVSDSNGISADGVVIIGESSSNIGTQAFRWTVASGMQGLGFLPGETGSVAYGASADGEVITGESGTQAFRWTETGGMKGLGFLPGETSSRANGISADGKVIVGASGLQAYRWTEVGGMESVAELLLSRDIDLTGWRLFSASDASKDGSIIVGGGEHSPEPEAGIEEAWMAKLDDVPPLNTNPIEISGIVKTPNDVDICAIVLASGKYTFSCTPPGEFSLTDIPRDHIGTVKRQIYADGFFPKIDLLTDSSIDAVVMTRSGTCPSYNTLYDPGYAPGSAGKWIYISGKVLQQFSQIPVCAMVLANGQYIFSCDGTGSYMLKIPLDTNGQFKLQVYAHGFAPTIQFFDEYKTTNNVRMARPAECQ
jgi:probable HAF family extracellular repeat protein